MKRYSLAHLSNGSLLRHLAASIAGERGGTADVLASIAEVDARKLYVPAGYSSMYLYCVDELHLSEQAAYRRIIAARTARRFPAIFEAVADGRLHLSAVTLMAPYLRAGAGEDLLSAATHKTKAEIEHLLAERFPRPDMPTCVEAIATPSRACQLFPEIVGMAAEPGIVGSTEALGFQPFPGMVGAAQSLVPERVAVPAAQPSPGIACVPAERPTLAPSAPPAPRPRVTPLSPERFVVRFTMPQSMRDKLQEAQELLSYQIPSGDIPAVLELGLEALIEKLRRAKFAATDRPRSGRTRKAEGGRYVPADVRRAVWERDGGRCTFVSETGHRCDARKFLEYDHVHPVARGGRATVGNVRLRCRAHNQYEAERVFGEGFMSQKREAAQRAAS